MELGQLLSKILSLGLKIKMLFLVGLVLSSCGNYRSEKGLGPSEPITTVTEDLAAKDFKSVQEAVFAGCMNCHAEVFVSYQAVLADLADISSRVTSNNMPKSGGPLSDEQKRILALWIANGAPEFAADAGLPPPVAGTPATPPVTTPPPPGAPIQTPGILEPTWESIQANIIIPKKCAHCHSPKGSENYLDFTNYQAVLAKQNNDIGNGPLIDLANPENSQLVVRVQSQDPEFYMPAAASGASRLTDSEVEVLIQWIRLGLPEQRKSK